RAAGPPAPRRRGRGPSEAHARHAGPDDPDREGPQSVLARPCGVGVRRSVLRAGHQELPASLAHGALRPPQRPEARRVARQGPPRPVLLRSLVRSVEIARLLPAAASPAGRRGSIPLHHARRHRPRLRAGLEMDRRDARVPPRLLTYAQSRRARAGWGFSPRETPRAIEGSRGRRRRAAGLLSNSPCPAARRRRPREPERRGPVGLAPARERGPTQPARPRGRSRDRIGPPLLLAPTHGRRAPREVGLRLRRADAPLPGRVQRLP